MNDEQALALVERWGGIPEMEEHNEWMKAARSFSLWLVEEGHFGRQSEVNMWAEALIAAEKETDGYAFATTLDGKEHGPIYAFEADANGMLRFDLAGELETAFQLEMPARSILYIRYGT